MPSDAVHPRLPHRDEIALEWRSKQAHAISQVRLCRGISPIERFDGVEGGRLVGSPGHGPLAGSNRTSSDGDVIGKIQVFDGNNPTRIVNAEDVDLFGESTRSDMVAPWPMKRSNQKPLTVGRRRSLLLEVVQEIHKLHNQSD